MEPCFDKAFAQQHSIQLPNATISVITVITFCIQNYGKFDLKSSGLVNRSTQQSEDRIGSDRRSQIRYGLSQSQSMNYSGLEVEISRCDTRRFIASTDTTKLESAVFHLTCFLHFRMSL